MTLFAVCAMAVFILFAGICVALAFLLDGIVLYATSRRHVVNEITGRFGLNAWEMEIFPDELFGFYGALDRLDMAFFSIMVRMGSVGGNVYLDERMKRFVNGLHLKYETAERYCRFVDSYCDARPRKARYMEGKLCLLEDFRWKGKR